jgi:hypothetical protein
MNTKDITAATSNILVVGDGGTHKTFLLGSFPKPYVFDFDGGMSILRGRDVEYDTFKDVPRGVPCTPAMTEKMGLYAFGTAWDAFFKKLQAIGERIDKGTGPETIGFDSLTTMSMIAVNHILLHSSHAEPHIGTWRAHLEYYKRTLSQVTAWPVRIVATAHIERKENELTHVTEMLPLLAGKLAGLIGIFFDEVYYTDVKSEAGKEQSFQLLTTSTPTMRQAKSRFGVKNGTPADFAFLKEYYLQPPEASRGASVATPVQGLKPEPKK